MKKRLHFAALAVCLAGTALSAGQQPPPPAQPPQPTFRVQVDYVEVDVVVTDQRGNLVRDLKKEDFQVFEDGKAQTISTFTHVDIPIERADRPLFAASPIEPDVKTNEKPFDGRVYVLVIDDLHTRFGRTQRVRSAARQFVQQRLGANDLMAVVHTFGPSDANQEFTNNKRLLLAAIDKTQGRKLDSATANKTREYYNTAGTRQTGDPLNDPDDQERSYNATSTLRQLQNIAQWFGSVRGRRKTILFFSEGIDYDLNELIASNGSTHRDATQIIEETNQVIQAATRSNVSIYGVDPRGLTDLGDESIEIGSYPDDTSLGIGQNSLMNELRTSQDSLRVLSDNTGGFAVVNRNDFSTAFDRIVEDNSSYYVLAYYPPDARPGRQHKISVRTSRPGLVIRARQGYVTPKKPAVEKPNPKDTRTPEIKAALDSPLPVSGLAMHVFAAPFKGAAPNASVLIGVELTGQDLKLDKNDQIQLSYMAIDAKGKVQGGNTDMVSMSNLRPETKARIESSGLRLLNRMDVPPGRYNVRVAAHDSAGGNVGAVQYDLEVPDFAKVPFSMSGVALTSIVASQLPTAHPDEQTRGVLPAPPAAMRSFPQNDELALFTEIYDNEAKTPHKVDITTTVTTDEGKEVFKTDEQRDTADFQGKTGGFGYSTRIPMKDFPPGAYVLKVSARSRLGNKEAVERQVRFYVTPPVAAR
jgi:VWFA-related protein